MKLETQLENVVIGLTERFIKEHDTEFDRGNLRKCYILEQTYDAQLVRFGINPSELHECIVSNKTIIDGVRKYFSNGKS